MTDYAEDIYKNWGNIAYLNQHATMELISCANKIKMASGVGPYIDSDIADFVYELLHRHGDAQDVPEHVEMAIRYMGKGNQKTIVRLVCERLGDK